VGRFIRLDIRLVISASTSGAGKGHANPCPDLLRILNRINLPTAFSRHICLMPDLRFAPRRLRILRQSVAGAGAGILRYLSC
jgi:hypothetical protein